ncbi:DUF3418 domain-containing protein, partial [Escherichia coli]|uniref:DUF3418 domain-containing protein n=1 Tax=Escherichia coli TaxID=562 RepID=UPI001C4EBEE6
ALCRELFIRHALVEGDWQTRHAFFRENLKLRAEVEELEHKSREKWGIHSTYSDNLLMLTLGRGGPVVWLSEADAKDLGIADNDWIEVFNSNGALTARAVVSQRVPAGMTMMYHAQERIVNLPGSEITQQRGGIHNSVTRITPKPTHMIGGYAHLAYGFNYYGTVGSNRDEFVVVRKMKNIDWLDGEGNDQVQESVK